MKSVAEILDGPIVDRGPNCAHLMTEAEARGVLRDFESQMPKSRRGAVARRLADSPHGRLTEEARALYAAYAAAYGA